MPRQDLKNKPLVEAILEVRWGSQAISGVQTLPVEVDPHYRLLLGRFSERVEKEYPFHEALAAASIPDQMVPQIVQHRFRARAAGWPVLQMGPGIMTVNDTDGYTWDDFQKRCEKAVAHLVDAYPSQSTLKVQDVILRYIDAVLFDYTSSDVFQFLKDKMRVTLDLPESLFHGTHVARKPAQFNWQTSFANTEPDGTIVIRFATVLKGGNPAILWETLIESTSQQAPNLRTGFQKWLETAHNIMHDWFFKLIQGDLERMFSNE